MDGSPQEDFGAVGRERVVKKEQRSMSRNGTTRPCNACGLYSLAEFPSLSSPGRPSLRTYLRPAQLLATRCTCACLPYAARGVHLVAEAHANARPTLTRAHGPSVLTFEASTTSASTSTSTWPCPRHTLGHILKCRTRPQVSLVQLDAVSRTEFRLVGPQTGETPGLGPYCLARILVARRRVEILRLTELTVRSFGSSSDQRFAGSG